MITGREVHSLAVAVHDDWLAQHRESSSEQSMRHSYLHERPWTALLPAKENSILSLEELGTKAGDVEARSSEPAAISVDDTFLR